MSERTTETETSKSDETDRGTTAGLLAVIGELKAKNAALLAKSARLAGECEELLAACKASLCDMTEARAEGEAFDDTTATEMLRAAIAKSEGRQMLLCSGCGSAQVSRAQWVDLNGGGIVEECGKPDWCWDCASDTKAIDAADYERQHAVDELAEDIDRDEVRS